MDAIRLAGITPTESGYTIAPHLPFARFSLRLPQLGIAAEAHRLRGYLTTQRTSTVRLDVTLPARVDTRSVVSWPGGRRLPAGHRDGLPRAPVTGSLAQIWTSPSASPSAGTSRPSSPRTRSAPLRTLTFPCRAARRARCTAGSASHSVGLPVTGDRGTEGLRQPYRWAMAK